MALFDELNPLEPLMWVEQTPLLTLTYLWHLSQEDMEQKQKSDLLWQLTRQLLIAKHYEDKITIEQSVIEQQIISLKQNEVISSLLEAKVIEDNVLIDMLRIQEIYFAHLATLRQQIIEQISSDDAYLQEYYENEAQFERSNVFEVYRCTIKDHKNTYADNLESLTHIANDIMWLGAFTIEELQEYMQKSYIPSIEELPILVCIDNKEGSYLFIEQFHLSYKPHYLKIKQTLVEALAENSLEYEIEQESQIYLEQVELKYNEKAIEQVFNLDQII